MAWTPEEIEKFRKQNGLTRKALGELLGVHIMAIYQWERGLKKPSKTAQILLSKIAEEFEEKKQKKGGKKKYGKGNL